MSLFNKACINWVVILKHKNSESNKGETTVKVKDVLRRTETEVSKTDLCQWLTAEINEQIRVDSIAIVRNKHELKSKDASDSGKYSTSMTFFFYFTKLFLSVRNDPFSLELSKGEGMEQKKMAFDVNIVFSESRGKERTKIKHKHKTAITDKGKHYNNI